MKALNIRKLPLFRSLPANELEYLAGVLVPVVLRDGQILFRDGESGDKFYIITDGHIEILKAMGTPNEQVLDRRAPGDFFGEMSLLIADGRRSASVRASGPVRLLEMQRTDFDRLLKGRPKLAFELVRELSLRLRNADEVMIRDLTEKNRQLAQSYRELQAAQEQIVEKEKLETELELARSIQESILPHHFDLLSNFEFGAQMLPARSVGGDFYDLMRLGEKRVGVSLGDVSDKGVPAAMFMALYCSLLRAEAHHFDTPGEVLYSVNKHLMQYHEARKFVTAMYGVLDATTAQFCYARAGHHLPILVDARGEIVPLEKGQGQLLGFFPDPDLDVQLVDLPSGSTLLMYTDGVLDSKGADRAHFGESRLKGVISKYIQNSAQDLCDSILSELKSFQGEDPQFDDITLVVIRSLQ
jgi:serine phosphatase RsbU (regulator of sigma subunit)